MREKVTYLDPQQHDLVRSLRKMLEMAEAGELEWLALTAGKHTSQEGGQVFSGVWGVDSDGFRALGAVEDLRFRVHGFIEQPQ